MERPGVICQVGPSTVQGEVSLRRLAPGALPGVEADREPLPSETGSI